MLLTTLVKESDKTIDWFRLNNRIVNFETFQSMVLQKSENTEICTL